jgi:tripartite ATP-independent transporter DctM subunit
MVEGEAVMSLNTVAGPSQSGPSQNGVEPARGAVAAARVLRVLDACIGNLAAIFLTALIVITFANVIGRYVFNYSLTWASEVAIWLFIYIIFLGIPLAERAQMHPSITLLVDRLPPRTQRAVKGVAHVLSAYTVIMLLFGSQTLLAAIGGTDSAIGAPVWLKFVMIPFASAVALLYIALAGFAEAGPARWTGVAEVAGAALLYLLVNALGWVPLPELNPALAMACVFAGGVVIGMPVAFAMLLAVFVSTLVGGMLPPAAIVQNVVNGSSKFLLLAIPFFITAGALMNRGRLTHFLIDFAHKLVGHLRGGMGQVNVFSAFLFSGISGSSYSEAALGSKLLVPQMVKRGYPPELAGAITASAAVIPNIVPPSIALLILAAATNLSVGDLWLAGVGPGVLLTLCLMTVVYMVARTRRIDDRGQRARAGERLAAFASAVPVLILAVVILGGIRLGIVTPTEAGVLAVVYSLLLGIAVYRSYNLRELWAVIRESAGEAALIGLLIGSAAPFAFVLVSQQVPQEITGTILGISASPWVVLLIVNLLLLVCGMVLDIGVAILILAPLILPLTTKLGYDPVHIGLVIVVNLMLGGLTPPVGMLAYVTSTVSHTPVHRIFGAIVPFLGAMIVGLLVISYAPAVSLGLDWLLTGR